VLLLGGHSALSEGGYADTVLAALSPAVLEAPAPEFRTAVTARVTRAGQVHPVTRDLMALDRALPLPALAVVNPLRRLKPGASMLLAGDDGTASPLVLLAHQRFGRGQVALLAARDSWRWRMHADVALDDRVHELFWRRLLRWLARDVPGQVEVQARPSPAGPGQTVILDAQVRDAAWQPIPHARVSALLTTPLGEIRTRALAPVPGRDRGFAGAFTAAAPGAHELLVSVRAGEEDVAGSGGFLVDPHGEEFRNAGLDEALLRRIAVATGGSYRHLDSPQALAERVLATAPSGERWQRVALWNAPALLLALLALACGEWWLRRRRRLA
jgi:hypothetical protein